MISDFCILYQKSFNFFWKLSAKIRKSKTRRKTFFKPVLWEIVKVVVLKKGFCRKNVRSCLINCPAARQSTHYWEQRFRLKTLQYILLSVYILTNILFVEKLFLLNNRIQKQTVKVEWKKVYSCHQSAIFDLYICYMTISFQVNGHGTSKIRAFYEFPKTYVRWFDLEGKLLIK